ncbi:MAG: 2-C-methyl-D-erythritol 4-phosphate cytidylyltransferase [bacterium]
MNIGVVIAAAGQSKRLGHNKVLMELGGKVVLFYSLEQFIKLPSLNEIVIVVRVQDEVEVKEILERQGYKIPTKIVVGGEERQDSVYAGLKALGMCDIVAIHDGARPFISYELIERLIEEAIKYGAVIPASPVKETIKVVREGYVESTLPREFLWSVQTPQVFRYRLIMEAYEEAFKNGFYGTDDASLVERFGYKVRVIPGEYTNLKITTREDLEIAQRYIKLLNL